MSSDTASAADPILRVEDLRIEFHTSDGVVQAVNGASFELARGETLGIVGESGSGKSVMNLGLLRLIPEPPGRIAGGNAWYDGQDLLSLSEAELCHIRGHKIAMIFQDPMTALNPFLSVAEQLTEVTRLHLGHTQEQAVEHAIDMLERVGIPAARQRVFDYPHQFSGGMRQRVMIAMALACGPDILIADEPTTALDVTIQAQILELMNELQRDLGMSIILITHDLGVVAKTCHRVHVMYGGRFVEKADVDSLFERPQHPYTLGLLHSVARLDERQGEQLEPIAGQPPDLSRLTSECTFRPRCPFSMEKCGAYPPLETKRHGGQAACWVDVEQDPRHGVQVEGAAS